MRDIIAWLEMLDLGKYAEIFAENEIDFKVLPQLTEEDIRSLGLPLGPQRKILTAIAALKSGAASENIRQGSDREATLERLPLSQAERRQL